MVKVNGLQPGDLVANPLGGEVLFVQRCTHPLYGATLDMVIWKMPDGSWSHDALDRRQEVGDVKPSTFADRMMRLREALHGASA